MGRFQILDEFLILCGIRQPCAFVNRLAAEHESICEVAVASQDTHGDGAAPLSNLQHLLSDTLPCARSGETLVLSRNIANSRVYELRHRVAG